MKRLFLSLFLTSLVSASLVSAKPRDYTLYRPRIPEAVIVKLDAPQVNTFCAANLDCTVTGIWTFSTAPVGLAILNGNNTYTGANTYTGGISTFSTVATPGIICPSTTTSQICFDVGSIGSGGPNTPSQLIRFNSTKADSTQLRGSMQQDDLGNLLWVPSLSVPAGGGLFLLPRLEGIRFVDTNNFANINAALTDAGTTGAVIIPPGYTGTDNITNTNNVPILDFSPMTRHAAPEIGIWSQIGPTFPVTNFPLGANMQINVRGPGDLHLTHATVGGAAGSLATTTTATINIGANASILVGSTANFTAGAGQSITISRDRANEETVTVPNWSIIDGTHISVTAANLHNEAVVDIEQLGSTFWESKDFLINSKGTCAAHATSGSCPLRIKDAGSIFTSAWPTFNPDPFPFNAYQFFSFITGWAGPAGQAGNANANLRFRNSTTSSHFTVQCNNANNCLDLDDSGNLTIEPALGSGNVRATTVSIAGSTSGAVTLAAPAIAGSPTATFSANSGTVPVTSNTSTTATQVVHATATAGLYTTSAIATADEPSSVVQNNQVNTGGASMTLNMASSGAITPSQTNGIVGTTTNNNANAGSVGEYVQSVLATGSSVTLATGVTSNVTSISLTAGDWDVTGAVDFTFGATTSYTNLIGSVSSTSATIGAQDSKFDFETPAAVPTAGADATFPLPVVRFSLSGTTTVFLVAQGTFTVSTLKAYGTIRARRIR